MLPRRLLRSRVLTKQVRAASTVAQTTVPPPSQDQPPLPATSWTRPLDKGVMKTYDLALDLINRDSTRLKAEMDSLRAQLKPTHSEQFKDEVSKKLEDLEVLSEINLPEIKWNFRNGKHDFSKPVYRHLAEREWREKGRLDHLMQRINTMHVIPDLVADLHPSIDLHLHFPSEEAPQSDAVEDIEAGRYLTPDQTINPPQLSVTAFHSDTRLYTLVMLDGDVPDPENMTYKQFLHWVVPNIPISATSSGQTLSLPTEQPASYISPHPQQGTKYHRYVTFLLPNPNPAEPISIPEYSMEDRKNFILRDFIQQHQFSPSTGGGAHLWRALWSPIVSNIYKDVLKTAEPRYGSAPKPDRFAEVKRTRRYL